VQASLFIANCNTAPVGPYCGLEARNDVHIYGFIYSLASEF
jgi:hypothetical protein